MDLKKPVIVLDHEPRQLEELNQAGVDIDLCGHTHDGQLFPSEYYNSFVLEESVWIS